MSPLPDANSPVEQRLAAYFDTLGTVLWDSRQRHCFASYAIGLMSELESHIAAALRVFREYRFPRQVTPLGP